ncbi:hypothetical protein Patl1_19101 [Pistacia atlantica]|uniref:Uncharacterized protein n=1 Tax=Pistacia atlantica TaxID=434234 RepID=A0ACC1C2L5_9ROSI|nr:hypothetical protein Patl1_19101 [Pistacia atlantica]
MEEEAEFLYITRTVNPLRRHVMFFPTSTSTSPTQAPTPTRLVVSAARKLSSRTGRFDSKKRRSGGATTTEEQQERTSEPQERRLQIEDESVGNISKIENVGVSVDDGLVVPDLPGEKPDFWEGSQWDGFGFFMQYMWAFGIGFAKMVLVKLESHVAANVQYHLMRNLL